MSEGGTAGPGGDKIVHPKGGSGIVEDPISRATRFSWACCSGIADSGGRRPGLGVGRGERPAGSEGGIERGGGS